MYSSVTVSFLSLLGGCGIRHDSLHKRSTKGGVEEENRGWGCKAGTCDKREINVKNRGKASQGTNWGA